MSVYSLFVALMCLLMCLLRRILFVGVLPLTSPVTATRASLGVVLSIASVVYFREEEPYKIEFSNFIAHVAQFVILITFYAALAIDTGVMVDFGLKVRALAACVFFSNCSLFIAYFRSCACLIFHFPSPGPRHGHILGGDERVNSAPVFVAWVGPIRTREALERSNSSKSEHD
jgi:hypothetical protein